MSSQRVTLSLAVLLKLAINIVADAQTAAHSTILNSLP
jgi:hypothetical protein